MKFNGVGTRLFGRKHHLQRALDFAVVVYSRLGNDEGGVSGSYSPSLDHDLRHSVVLEERLTDDVQVPMLQLSVLLIVTSCDLGMEFILCNP